MVNPNPSYYEKPAEGAHLALCIKCGAIKPLSEFKRKLSRMQSQARGYIGLTKLEIDSSMCKACQPKAKPVSEQSAKSLKNMATSGDKRPYIVQAILAERKANKVITGRISSLKRWANVHAARWGSVMAGLKDELLAVHQQCKYAKKQQGKTGEQQAKTGGQLVHEFLTTYKDTLIQTQAHIVLAAERTQGGPEKHANGTDWLSYIAQEDIDTLLSQWTAIDPSARYRMRQPAILNRVENRHRVGYTATTQGE